MDEDRGLSSSPTNIRYRPEFWGEAGRLPGRRAADEGFDAGLEVEAGEGVGGVLGGAFDYFEVSVDGEVVEDLG